VRDDSGRPPLVAWRGIPYAAPPVGPLRFRAPEPPLPWHGVRDASRFGPAAPQKARSRFEKLGYRAPLNEDCLTLNVLRAESGAQGRPVMVFIHGGAYRSGTGSHPMFRGNRLVSRGDIVYVSINYRLGALGYLDFREYGAQFQCNLGLRDQVAALRWVHENIAAFGGDPQNVTIFGESSGGNAVTTLMATPSARGSSRAPSPRARRRTRCTRSG
jgi:para-nitrobenzyl esterase